jgi:hypothetical protein
MSGISKLLATIDATKGGIFGAAYALTKEKLDIEEALKSLAFANEAINEASKLTWDGQEKLTKHYMFKRARHTTTREHILLLSGEAEAAAAALIAQAEVVTGNEAQATLNTLVEYLLKDAVQRGGIA